MSSGGKRLVYTWQQRILTGDWTRMQDFQNADRSEVLRRLYGDVPTAALTQPGVHTEETGAVATPLQADVLGGLMVQCDHPTNIFVSPGALMAWTGTPVGDDSGAVFVNDPGVTAILPALAFVANGGAGPRIDVIECQPVEVLVSTLTRDIYDPATRLFSPVAGLDYVKEMRLVYRITSGVAGGGAPALSAGWLPLAVAVVQPGATGWNDSDFYDVRPLVDERVPAPFGGLNKRGRFVDGEYEAIRDVGGTTYTVTGWAVFELGRYYAGGALYRSTCVTHAERLSGVGDAKHVDAHVASNCAPGCDLNEIVYMLAGFPMGLPRWVRYSEAAIGPIRLPNGPRGIVFFQSHNGVFGGLHTSATGVISVALPAICGFTVAAECVVMGTSTEGSTAMPDAARLANRICRWANLGAHFAGVPGGPPDNTMTFTVSGLEDIMPIQAAAVILDIRLNAGGLVVPNELTVTQVDAGSGVSLGMIAHLVSMDYTGGYHHFQVRVPLELPITPYTSGIRPASTIRVVGIGALAPVYSAGDAYVVGYEF